MGKFLTGELDIEAFYEGKKIQLCKWYSTTGHPKFNPVCKKNLIASLKCHKANKCTKYTPSVIGEAG